MLSYTVNIAIPNKSAVANEVLDSAARILGAVGFTQNEVVELFTNYADRLAGNTSENVPAPDGAVSYVEHDPEEDSKLWNLVAQFEKIPAARALNRLGKRLGALDDLREPASLEQSVALLTEAMKLRIESLVWLRAEAEKSGLVIADDREAWVASASDEQLDAEDDVVFLDDYHWSAGFNWHVATRVADQLLASGNVRLLHLMCEALLKTDISIESRIREQVQRAMRDSEIYEKFIAYIRVNTGSGEVLQSEFLDRFARDAGADTSSYVFQTWLEALANTGQVQRFKRSNRWRIVIP